MKKLLLCTMLFALSFAYGQESDEKEKLIIKKGTWYVNGGFSIYTNNSTNDFSSNVNKSESLNFNISPKIGYSITNNLIIGLGIGYGYNKHENNPASSNSIIKNKSYSIFPYIKKYFSLGKKLAFSLHGEFRYTHSKYENHTSLNNVSFNKSNDYFVGIRPGVTYFLNNKIALEANIGALGYTRTIHKSPLNTFTHTIDNFNFNLNSSNLNFGLSYYW
ncbi:MULTISPECIES: outer membrane beta-barrel protein [unclassified Tenacibaculum]|uniref:outer membrane beta-barrel protein n=1 Tax=unclassified Tenacibaculum TaxID=2635139 RepID=UPI001F168DF1|nr:MULTISPECIES: outer membrane beta-barrel protein [unclassified Tenacibaculum]MCF2876257.1 porin family protein [Tenacibaculum sp. Cn5-1]MCF2936332.1 porin family protein [Tenacibaculum sp. Cn5-34]MCG7511675.1 porin family protein [Tenacibaculum sp. Cn5-46]